MRAKQRYKLLLQTLLSNTSQRDPERPLIEKSIEAMDRIAGDINAAIREKQDLDQLFEIQQKFKNSPVCQHR